ncbi:carbohydrate ABC transporter permease [Phytoactinopolyspora alkaliphila]|uniref:Carbohydrate ABC transporter permease n=1 Tax=Phytoactinopolyspora alkaliphila TaxID=1783498 RepID=A0A6N9YPA6_9ACTN|nr:carbohydrate ABC transporter permease [Phytoactinopolyspora alkaliphila]NED96876.1 carbohydrate ABC transporter permease [Phytoactinopolyspora alkaliphila]
MTRALERMSAYTALIVMAMISVIPLLWIWVQSLRTSAATAANPFGLEWPLQVGNYATAWNAGRFADYLMNSTIVAVGTVTLVVAVAFPAAYALGTLDLRWANGMFMLFLLGLMIPIWSIVIPLFYQMRSLGLINTLIGAILIEAALGLPFAIFLLRANLRGLPRELLEAGRIDGGGDLRLMWSVVRPLAAPALGAIVVFQFMMSWNELIVPLFFLQTDDVRTLPIGLTFFQGRFTTDTAVLAAGTTLASLPVVVVYMIFNRQFVAGLTAGATK